MPRLLRSSSLLGPLALGAALALSPLADAAPTPRYAGVTWQDPPGMEVSSWPSLCPGRCVGYEDKDDMFPLILVHEPLSGSSAQAMTTLLNWMRQERGEFVEVEQSPQEQVGALKVQLAVFTRADDPEDRRPDSSLFLLLEQGGVTLPLELHALSREDLGGPRQKTVIALADTVRLNPEAVKKDLAFRAARFANLERAIADGYARGEQARVFMYQNVSVGVVYRGALGLQQQVNRQVGVAAFLPGGVFLGTDPEPDYRAPNLRRTGGGEFPDIWKAVKGGFEVTSPDGEVTRYALGANGEGATVRVDGKGQPYYEAVRLGAPDLVGVFSNSSVSSSSAMGTAVFSRSDQDLELRSGGRYLTKNSSFTSFSGPAASGSTGSQTPTGGQWSYDPASFTLTLRPDGGGVLSGPTYTVNPPRLIKPGQSSDWTVMSRSNWWKR